MSDIERDKRETRRQKIKQQKRRRLIAWVVVLVVGVLLVFGIIKLVGWIFTPKYIVSANLGPALPPAEGPIVITTAPKYYDYTLPAPEAAPVENSYFNSVLMIGDSRVSGFPVYGYLPNADYLVSDNISVDVIESYTFQIKEGEERTLSEQLAAKQYDSIYIEVGLNELGWPNVSAFTESYARLVDTLKSLAPNASIYMQSIIPMTASKSGNPSHLTNEKVAEYNNLIKQIAESKQVYFLDVAEGLSGGTGVLTSGYAANNGLSLTKDGYNKWIDYIKTHVVDKEIYS